jgi:hypothetical protein
MQPAVTSNTQSVISDLDFCLNARAGIGQLAERFELFISFIHKQGISSNLKLLHVWNTWLVTRFGRMYI